MTIRPFHLIDRRGWESPRSIAVYFTFLTALGILPALFGLFYLGLFGLGSLIGGKFEIALPCLLTWGFIAYGLRLSIFYFRRVRGRVEGCKRRWFQTVNYNGAIAFAGFIWTLWEPSFSSVGTTGVAIISVVVALSALSKDRDPTRRP